MSRRYGKLAHIATIAINLIELIVSRLFALISLKIQLNYFAIVARPSSVPVSDMHEIRNSRSVTCLPRLLVVYARSITSEYTVVPTSGSSTNWYRTTVCILTTGVDVVDMFRPSLLPAFVKSFNTRVW